MTAAAAEDDPRPDRIVFRTGRPCFRPRHLYRGPLGDAATALATLSPPANALTTIRARGESR